MQLFDSHAHLTCPSVYEEIEGVLSRAQQANVTQIVNICTDIESLNNGLLLKKNYPWVYHAAATTPHDVDKEGESVFPTIAHHARQGDLIAVGETGLDYYYDHSAKETQQRFLKKYLHLSLECNLPVIFHCRDAFEDLFKITDQEYEKDAPALLHCFTGTLEEAKEVIARGWYLSLSGIVTFKKSEALRQVAKIVPLDQLLIETDTPYLAPQSKRGKPNEPAYIVETAQTIAEAKNLSLEEVAQHTANNCKRLFTI